MDTDALATIVATAVVGELVRRSWDGLEARRNNRRKFRNLLRRAEELDTIGGPASLPEEAKVLLEACELAPRRRKRELIERTRDIYLKLGDLAMADMLARQLQQTGGIFGLLHRKVCTPSTVSPAGPASASRRTSGGTARAVCHQGRQPAPAGGGRQGPGPVRRPVQHPGTVPSLPAPVEIPISELPPED